MRCSDSRAQAESGAARSDKGELEADLVLRLLADDEDRQSLRLTHHGNAVRLPQHRPLRRALLRSRPHRLLRSLSCLLQLSPLFLHHRLLWNSVDAPVGCVWACESVWVGQEKRDGGGGGRHRAAINPMQRCCRQRLSMGTFAEHSHDDWPMGTPRPPSTPSTPSTT